MKNAGFLFCDLVFVTSANILLKLAADAHGTWLFVTMLAAGNLAGLVGVLAYTALLRGMSLHVADPLTEGLTAIGVQLIGGMIVFRERNPPLALAGTGLVLSGIVLFSL